MSTEASSRGWSFSCQQVESAVPTPPIWAVNGAQNSRPETPKAGRKTSQTRSQLGSVASPASGVLEENPPPLPSHLPGPIPSIKLQKQVSQQPGRGKVSVCLLPSPTPPGQLCLSPPPHASMGCTHVRCTGLHRDAAREGDRSLQPPYR